MSTRRLLPPAIAVVVIAVVGTVLWLANRSAPIPTTVPKTAPAVRSCWNVDSATIGRQLPWSGSPVACTAAHTAEIVSVGQVDQRLVRTAQKAKGQDATVNSFVMATSVRAACLDKVGSYVGGAWRGAQLTVYPDFVAPAKDGFFACVIAQVADPGGQRLVTRTASLAGALSGSGAASLGIDCVGDSTSSVRVGSTSAGGAEPGAFGPGAFRPGVLGHDAVGHGGCRWAELRRMWAAPHVGICRPLHGHSGQCAVQRAGDPEGGQRRMPATRRFVRRRGGRAEALRPAGIRSRPGLGEPVGGQRPDIRVLRVGVHTVVWLDQGNRDPGVAALTR